jgi:DNA-binding CsgD family transcriptional regulator
MRPILDTKLFMQPFAPIEGMDNQLEQAKYFARLLAHLENGISVLSDIKARKSYIYQGGLADQIGVQFDAEVINSVWEDELLNRVHSEDLERKYRLEVAYFKMLKGMNVPERADYSVITRLRIKDNQQRYLNVQHRLFYVGSLMDGSISLALCLYNRDYGVPGVQTPYGVIVNNRLGKVVEVDSHGTNVVLTARENEVLQQIKQGKRSKEIAADLMLSINTVNRHRQNIFKKLKVGNAIEACQLMDDLD